MHKITLKDYITESLAPADLLTGSKNEKKEKLGVEINFKSTDIDLPHKVDCWK